MKVALSAQILKAETKPDNTLLLKINTQEPTPEEAAQIFKWNMKQIYIVLIDENEVEGAQNDTF